MQKTERVLNRFLKDSLTHEALELREALFPEVETHDFFVEATASDGTTTILAFDGDALTFYRRHGEAIDVVTHKVRGATLAEHRKVVEGRGLMTTGFTLKHPVLPLSGELTVDAYDVHGEEAAFKERVKPFLVEGRAPNDP